MSILRIEERFEVEAAPDVVFAFLTDPERLVACMPGATLEEVQGERNFLGSVRVKVGAITVAYRGAIELTEVDSRARRIRATGKGREKGGAGRVSLELDGAVDESPGGSQVVVRAEVALAGKIVRFGRGMIDSVSQQLFADFSRAMRERLESETRGEAPEVEPEEAGPIRALPLLLRSFWSWLRRLLS